MISLSARTTGPMFLLMLLLASGTAYAGAPPAIESDTVGVFNPTTDTFFLTNANVSGPAFAALSYGPADSIPTLGDFNGSGNDTLGVFSPMLGRFFFKNTNAEGTASFTVGFGPVLSSLIPLVGNWDGLGGTDTPGLYDPVTSTFFLTNFEVQGSAGAATEVTSFGPDGAGYTPLSGNWTGAGSADGIGLYDPATGVFFLKNDATTNGNADIRFRFGPGGAGFLPLAGDWDDDGIDTVGIYNPATGVFFLTNTNVPGPAVKAFGFGGSAGGLLPVKGNYNGD